MAEQNVTHTSGTGSGSRSTSVNPGADPGATVAATGGGKAAPPPPKVFRIKRFQIGLNVLIQILVVIFILVLVNVMAFRHYKRWDFSRDKQYELSEQTAQKLQSLEKPVKFVVFFSPDPRTAGGEVIGDVNALLKEFQYAGKGKVDVEHVDPYRNLSRARELAEKYKFGNENVVIVDYQGRSKLVNATDMVEYDQSGMMYGQPPRVKAFKGEGALTSALIEVTEDKQSKIYVLGGKGGPELKDDELAVFKAYLERQNVEAEMLSLMNVEKVPEDAKTIFLVGARYDLTERELGLLRDFWNRNGRLFIALNADASTPNLRRFLGELGVKPNDDQVLVTGSLLGQTVLMRDVSAVFVGDDNPITKALKGVETIFVGHTQSLSLDPAPARADNNNLTKTQPLVQAAKGYWGETKYQNMQETGVYFDPKEDNAAPLTIGAMVERGALPDQRVKVDTPRMIVIGNGDFLNSAALAQAAPNLDFALSGVNWLLNREELIGIAPKEQKQFVLNLSPEQVNKIGLLVFGTFIGWVPVPGAIPGAAALLGLLFWLQRRR